MLWKIPLIVVCAFLSAVVEAAQGYKLRSLKLQSSASRGYRRQAKHILPLRRRRHKLAGPQSSQILSTLHNGVESNGIVYGVSQILPTHLGQEFSTTIRFGTQWFEALLDTGSSDTWLVQQDFTCVDGKNTTLDESECKFGPRYNPSSKTLQLVQNQNFNMSYASGEVLNGVIGRERVTLANITFYHQTVGLVNLARWYGDGISSGLIGMAYSSLTSAFHGTDAAEDDRSQAINYPSLLTTMIKQDVPPVFTISINRNPTFGGLLSIGGLPPGAYFPRSSFAHTPIQILQVIPWPQTASAYSFYTIYLDGFVYRTNFPLTAPPKQHRTFFTSLNQDSGQFNWTNPFHARSSFPVDSLSTTPVHPPHSTNLTVANATQPAIVDSGTTFNFFPASIATAVNTRFDPPAYYDELSGGWFVFCNSTSPEFGVTIGGKTFWHNGRDLKIYVGSTTGICACGVQAGSMRFTVLGDVFLKNVLAVFDVGAGMMRFAQR